MSNSCISLLIDLMEKCHIPKQTLLDAIDQVHYYSALPSPRSVPPRKPTPKVSVTRISRKQSKPALYEVDVKQLKTFAKKSSLRIISHSNSTANLSAVQSCRNVTPKPSTRAFMERTVAYEAHKTSRMEKRKEMLSEVEQENCSFRPRINPHQRQHDERPVHEKLYGMHKQSKQKNEALKARKDAITKVEEIMECTFKPAIYSKQAKPRYMLRTKPRQSQISTSQSFYQVSKRSVTPIKADKKPVAISNKTVCNTTTRKSKPENHRQQLLYEVSKLKKTPIYPPFPSVLKEKNASQIDDSALILQKQIKLQILREALEARAQNKIPITNVGLSRIGATISHAQTQYSHKNYM